MSANTVAQEKSGASTTCFISAIGVENLGSLPSLLKALAAESGACGCVLWESVAPPGLGENGSDGYLVQLGQWFPEGHLCHPHPPLDSAISEAVLTQRPVHVGEDAFTDSRAFADAGLLERAGVKGAFVVPLNYGFGAVGAVSFFRQSADPFGPEEEARVERLASAVPFLYRANRNEVRCKLTSRIDKILGRGEARNPSRVPINHRVKRDLFQLCKAVADALKCGEVSIFLKDSTGGESALRLAATTRQEQSSKSSQQEGGGELNGWAAGKAAPVHVLDLCRVGGGGAPYEQLLPDLGLKGAPVGDGGGEDGDGASRPLSLAVAPITAGGELLGCIRCCTDAKDGRHLTTHDFKLLEFVAARFARYWDNWLRECGAHEERLSWLRRLQDITALDEFALDALSRGVADAERLICEKALGLAAAAIKGADFLDVRAADEGSEAPRLLAVCGEAWAGADATLRQSTLPYDEAADAAWADAFQKGGACLRAGDSIERFYADNFPGARHVMTSPIPLPGGRRAVLDVCGTGEESFSEHDSAFAEMICKRLGAYGHYAESLEKASAADAARAEALSRATQSEARLEELIQIHSQFHEDLSHQLKSPLISASTRGRKVLKQVSLENRLFKEWQAIIGLCSKATQVTNSTKLFAALARGEAFEPNLSPLWDDDLWKMLIELASDSELLFPPKRHVSFRVSRQMLVSLPPKMILAEVDNDLLQQALNNLLDNAGKYSFENTTVRISASFDKAGHFFISVVNQGLAIRAADVPKCTQRRWRGREAGLTTGEGSGLGLWIVEHIMKAHGGYLEIIPTTPNNLTEVRLVFPKRGEAR